MKKLLSLVLICAMGFGMISCVESEESPSVENIRNAKAEQLKALAELSRAQAQAEIIRAEAEAALNAASAEYKQNQTAEAKAEFAYKIEYLKAKYEADVLNQKKLALQYEKDVQNAMNALEDAVNDRIETLFAEYSSYVSNLNDANNNLMGKKIDLAQVEAEIVDITEAANKEIEDNTALVEELEAQLAILTDNGYTQMDKDSLTNEYLKALAAYNDADYKYQSTEVAAYNDAKKAAEDAQKKYYKGYNDKVNEMNGLSVYGIIGSVNGDNKWITAGTGVWYDETVHYYGYKTVGIDTDGDGIDDDTETVICDWDDVDKEGDYEIDGEKVIQCYHIDPYQYDWTSSGFEHLEVFVNESPLLTLKNNSAKSYEDALKALETESAKLENAKAAQTAAKGFEKAFADADAARKAIEAFKEAYAKYDEAGETVKAKEDALVATKKDTIATGPYLTLINANAALDVLTNEENEDYATNTLVKAVADAKAALAALPTTATAAEKAAAEGNVTTAQKALDKAIYDAQVAIVDAKAGVKTYEDKVDEAAAAIETAKENEKALLAANTAALAAVETLNNTFGKDSDFYAFYTEIDENGNVVGNSKNCYGYFNEDGNGYWFNDFFEVTLLNDDNADGNPDLDLDADNGLYKANNTLSYTDFTAMIANTSPREDEAPVFEDFLKGYDAVIATAADQVTAKNKTIAELKDWVADWDGKEAELRAWVEAKNAEIAEVRAAYEEFTKAEDAKEAAKKDVDALKAEYQALSTLLSTNGNYDLTSKISDIENKIENAENAIKDAKLVLASLKTASTSWGYNYQTIAYKEKLVEQYKAQIAVYEAEVEYYTQMVANAKAALDAELSAQNAE